MNDILIISTGGTFNKIYNPISGELEIDKTTKALNSIQNLWGIKLKVISIISKDSLDMTHDDREELMQSIITAKESKIVIIHGTDTMDTTASFLRKHIQDKTIVLTGSMVPYSISHVGATANLAFSCGFMLSNPSNAVYISMNGLVMDATLIKKDKDLGCFVAKEI